MWYLLAYVIYELFVKKGVKSISKKEMEKIILEDMWQKSHVTLYDNRFQLEDDLKTLENLGLIKLTSDKIIIGEAEEKRLRKLSESINNDPLFTDSGRYFTALFKRRIDESIRVLSVSH